MVQIDTRLALGIEQPNLLGAMAQGTQNAGNMAALMRQAEAQNLFRQYGGAAMQGDVNALKQIAGFDPGMAQGLQLNQRQDQRADAALRLAQEAGARAAAEAQDRRAAAAELDQAKQFRVALGRAYAAGDQEAVAALTTELIGRSLELSPDTLRTVDGFLTGFEGGLSQTFAPSGPQWRAATPEEAVRYGVSSGQINTATGEFKYPPTPLVDQSGWGIGGTPAEGGGGVPLPAANPTPPGGASEAFGLEGLVKRGVNAVTDFVSGSEAFPNAAEQMRFFKNLEEDMLVGLSQAYGRQPAQQLMERLRLLLPNAGTLEGSGAAIGELRQMEARFKSDLAALEERANGRIRMTASDRNDLQARISGLTGTIARIEEAIQRFAPPESETAITPEDEALIQKYLNP
jgi:hypothetical protein